MTTYIWEKLVKRSETGSLTAELYRGCYTLMCMDVLRGAGVQVSSPRGVLEGVCSETLNGTVCYAMEFALDLSGSVGTTEEA